MTFRLAVQSKCEVCIDISHSLFDGRPKFLPGRSRRVSFVANLILFNVNQPNPNPMTMSICSLDLCCVSPVYVIHLLHHVAYSRYSGGVSLRCGSLGSRSIGSGSLRGGSLRGGSLGTWIAICGPHQLCVHAIICLHNQALHTQDGS